ncbi:MAG: phosphatidate cytidylyltransferase [Benjaminiella poitrasii]|nr:MAG: phosphatidate cytidylyltransferase [Benjaminiella poitrasii]
MVKSKKNQQQQQKQQLNQNKVYPHVPMKGGWEIPRKLFHYSIGFAVLYLYLNGTDTRDVYPILTVFLCIVLTGEFLRFNFDWFNDLYCYILGPLMRPSEVNKLNGVVYYLLGCIIVLYAFPRDLAALSIIYLSWTDPTASICGKLWGKYTWKYNGGKSLAGSLGAAITGGLVTWIYYQLNPSSSEILSYRALTSPVPLWLMSIYGGLVAAFSEGVSDCLYKLDDNLTIPVISAILLWIPLVGLRLGY